MADHSFPTGMALRQMMRRGDTEGTLRLLRQTEGSAWTALAQRLGDGTQHYRDGLIKGENWGQLQLQLYQALLDLMPEAQNPPAALAPLPFRRLVDKHEIGAALAACEALGDASILMQARYEIYGKLYAEGTIGLETWEIIQHQTQYELWEWAEQAASSTKASKKVWKWVRRWWKGR